MDILKEKQFEFFDLADNLYIDCINKYRNLLNCKSEIDSKAFSNEMRFICSQMGLTCEYYLKGLIFPHLRIDIPEDKEEYRTLIESLSEEEIYKILIGDDDILRTLSQDNSIRLRDLKFLQQYSIKNSGHNLLNLINKFSESDYADIPNDLKERLFVTIKSYYFNYFGFTEDYKRVNASDNDIVDAIDVSNISDAFAKGRYGHLDEFNLDYLKMIKLMHALRSCCERSSNAFSVVNGVGPYGTENASDITMIFPDENSKIYIIDDNSNVTRVYKHMSFDEFLKEAHNIAFEKVAEQTKYFDYFSRDDRKKIQLYIDELESTKLIDLGFEGEKYFGIDLTLVPVYGINEMKKVTINHDVLNGKYYNSNMLLPLWRQLYIDKDKKQTICFTSNGVFISYTQYSDNKIRKDSGEITMEKAIIIEKFESQEHSKDEVVEEFIDFEEEKNRQKGTILFILGHKIENIELLLSMDSAILGSVRLMGDSRYISYLRQTKQLKAERRELLKEYKKISKNLKEGRGK